jgi:hypothetical protein
VESLEQVSDLQGAEMMQRVECLEFKVSDISLVYNSDEI